jgi:type IV pilus assembly protein PilA
VEEDSMRQLSPRQQEGFTLSEIMIVVGLIGLLAALMVPAFIKNRKMSQGRRIVNDARVIDAAINAWALEVAAVDDSPVDVAAAGQYTGQGTINTTDLLGNTYGIGFVGSNQVTISTTTKSALSGVSIDWGPY